MKKKRFLFFTAMLALMTAFTASGTAEGLNVHVNEKYSTGEPMLIMIKSNGQIDPSNIQIRIDKPNGTNVETVPRRQSWNAENECFEIYTIDLSGNYKISVSDQSTGESASAEFTADVFSQSSLIFFVVSIAIFLFSMLAWLMKSRKKGI